MVDIDAPPALAELIRSNLDLPQEQDANTDEGERVRWLRHARMQTERLLETEGYFTPEIKVDVSEGLDRLHIAVQSGPQAHVDQVSIEFRGDITRQEAAHAERMASLRAGWTLKSGAPFRQESWSKAKQALLQKLVAKDYAAGSIAESAAEVDPQTARVNLRVVLDSGPPFTLGALEIIGLESFSPDLVRRYSNLEAGEAYDQERLLALQTALQNQVYFASVAVEIDHDPQHPEKVPVRVTLREAKTKHVNFGAGFSSNTGARAEVSYRDANLLDRAWSLAVGAQVDQKRQFGYVDIYLPPRPNAYRDSFGLLAERTDIQGLRSQRSAVAAVRARHQGRIETKLSLSLENERLRKDNAAATSTQALALNYSWTYRAIDNVLDPREGYTLNLQVGGGVKGLLSDQNFVRGYSRFQFFQPVGNRDALILRSELGYTAAKSRAGIPQDFLFRTGGAQTVRGYNYQSLGVSDGGAVVGGRNLIAASAEYVHWLEKSQWGIAGFYDIGNAWDSGLRSSALVSGYGLGARWRSPAGPLAIDLAYGQQDRKLRLHFAVAIAF